MGSWRGWGGRVPSPCALDGALEVREEVCAVGGTAWPRGGHPVGQVRPQPWEGGQAVPLLMVLGQEGGGAHTAGSPVSRAPGADVASSGGPARRAPGRPRPSKAGTCPLNLLPESRLRCWEALKVQPSAFRLTAPLRNGFWALAFPVRKKITPMTATIFQNHVPNSVKRFTYFVSSHTTIPFC